MKKWSELTDAEKEQFINENQYISSLTGLDINKIESYNGKHNKKSYETIPEATDELIYNKKATEITLSVWDTEIEVGGEMPIFVITTPDTANIPELVFESSDPDTAYMDGNIIRARKVSTNNITITATDSNNPSITATLSISIVNTKSTI